MEKQGIVHELVIIFRLQYGKLNVEMIIEVGMMKRIQLGKSDLQAPNIALGCMGMWKLSVKEAEKVINVNMTNDVGINRDDSVLDYCRLNNITVQAWSPFRYGQFEGFFIDNEKFPELNAKLQEVGDKYGVDKSAIAVSWILRHPAKIQTIVGTMRLERLTSIAKASDIVLTREEWYDIYLSAGHQLP